MALTAACRILSVWSIRRLQTDLYIPTQQRNHDSNMALHRERNVVARQGINDAFSSETTAK